MGLSVIDYLSDRSVQLSARLNVNLKRSCTLAHLQPPTGQPNSTLTVLLTLIPGSSKDFRYTAELPHGGSLLSITGTFRSGQQTHMVYCMSEVCQSLLLFSYCVFMYPLQHVFQCTGRHRQQRTYTDLTHSSIAVLECNPGYRPESSLNRTCGSDGHWSEEELSCVVIIQSGKYS